MFYFIRYHLRAELVGCVLQNKSKIYICKKKHILSMFIIGPSTHTHTVQHFDKLNLAERNRNIYANNQRPSFAYQSQNAFVRFK